MSKYRNVSSYKSYNCNSNLGSRYFLYSFDQKYIFFSFINLFILYFVIIDFKNLEIIFLYPN